MKIKLVCIAIGCAFSLNAIAGPVYKNVQYKDAQMAVQEDHPWSMIGSFGYTWYNSAYDGGSSADPDAQNAIGDGQTPLGRFAIARSLGTWNMIRFGLEVGVQSGNDMRLNIPQTTLNLVGGVPVDVTIKPMLDLLLTLAYQPVQSFPVYGILKGGIAYRRLQVNERVTFNDISQGAFEVQAGLGMNISERATLSVNYQGVFDGNTNYSIDAVTGTGHISNIPSQNGLFLSLSYAV